MTKARIEEVEIKPAVPAVTEKKVILELTMDEAYAIRALLGKLWGGSFTFPLYTTLGKTLGVNSSSNKYRVVGSDGYGNRPPVPTLKLEEIFVLNEADL